MRKFFSNKKIIIVVVCVLLALGLITGSVAVRNKKSTPTFIQSFGNDVVGIVDHVVAVPMNGLQDMVDSTGNLFNTYQENNQLKGQVQGLEATKARNQSLQNENDALKQQLHLNGTLSSYKKITASVLTRTPSSWQKQIIINKGSLAGVQKDMAVVVNSGLAGRVVEVNKTNSKVELVTDSSGDASRFAVQVQDGGKETDGLLHGFNTKNNQLVMDSVTDNSKVKNGAKVVTSGLGGVTPKGIFVGTVAGTSQGNDGVSKNINIKPAGDLQDIQVVNVLGKKE